MIPPMLRQLAVLTIQNPAEAAHQLIDLNLRTEALWTALALTAVLNAMAGGINDLFFPIPEDFEGLSPGPVAFVFITLVTVPLMAAAIYQVGRLMGGQGRFGDIFVLLIWMQALRVAVQLVLTVIVLLIPALGALFVLAVALASLWILLNLINVAHGYDSLGKSGVALFAALLGLAFAISLLLNLSGIPLPGLPANV